MAEFLSSFLRVERGGAGDWGRRRGAGGWGRRPGQERGWAGAAAEKHLGGDCPALSQDAPHQEWVVLTTHAQGLPAGLQPLLPKRIFFLLNDSTVLVTARGEAGRRNQRRAVGVPAVQQRKYREPPPRPPPPKHRSSNPRPPTRRQLTANRHSQRGSANGGAPLVESNHCHSFGEDLLSQPGLLLPAWGHVQSRPSSLPTHLVRGNSKNVSWEPGLITLPPPSSLTEAWSEGWRARKRG